MPGIRSFKDLAVWQRAHSLFLSCTSDVDRFPRTTSARVIAEQLLKAVASISANISEGWGRHKGKEFIHFLIVARGSAQEAENWYLKARDLGFLPEETVQERIRVLAEIVRMLNSLIQKVSTG